MVRVNDACAAPSFTNVNNWTLTVSLITLMNVPCNFDYMMKYLCYFPSKWYITPVCAKRKRGSLCWSTVLKRRGFEPLSCFVWRSTTRGYLHSSEKQCVWKPQFRPAWELPFKHSERKLCPAPGTYSLVVKLVSYFPNPQYIYRYFSLTTLSGYRSNPHLEWNLGTYLGKRPIITCSRNILAILPTHKTDFCSKGPNRFSI